MYRFRPSVLVFLSLFHAGICFGALGGAKQLSVCSGSTFRIEVIRRTRLRKEHPIQGRLLEPIYAENRLAIASGALLEGRIVAMRPAAHDQRLEAKFRGDFTPLAEPLIQWTTLSRSDGSQYPLLAESAGGAGSTLYFRSARGPHLSLFRRGWNTLIGRKNSAMNTVKAPHKMDRLQKFFWSQMPYHPQYIEEGSQFEMALTGDLLLSAEPPLPQVNLSEKTPLQGLVSVHSRLRSDLNSAKAKPGDSVEAIVTEPVLDAQNQLIIPQNSLLHGKVMRAIPSRRWGHNGVLRFSFNEVSWPSGFRQNVQATPMAIAARPDTKLQIDQEGGVVRQSNHGIAAPLLMGLLAASALGDDDGGLAKSAVSSNGFGIIARLLAIATSSRYVGGVIGAVGTGRSIYTHWLAHGKDTHFGNDTEVLLEMSPAHAHRMSSMH